jgi:anti-sigma B factor antagonist
MEITINQAPSDITVVAIIGDIDGKTSLTAQEKVMPLVKDNCKLLLNMSEVDHMSSAGLRFILSLQRRLPKNANLVVVGLSKEIRDTMRVTGFLDVFTVRDNVTEGLQVLN